MRYFYFLTIDQVKLDCKLTKLSLLNMRNDICTKSGLRPLFPHQVHCFEYKFKGKKIGHYLHYHCILESDRSYIPYKDFIRKGYSNKCEKLKTSADVAFTAGYINKKKVDFVDVDHLKKFLKK